MAAFRYLALTAEGKKKKGQLESESARSARFELRSDGLLPLQVDPVNEKPSRLEKTVGFTYRKSVSAMDLALVTRQMATLLAAGIPMDEMLMAVAEQAEKTPVKNVLWGVHGKVLEGYSLAESMKGFPHAFPKLYRVSVAAGESAGRLDAILLKLAEFTERQHQVRQKVRQALLYPSLMTAVSITILVFLLIDVVPKIVGVFVDTHQALPLPTLFLIKASHVLQQFGFFILMALGGAAYLFWIGLRRPTFRKKYDACLLKLPVIGKAVRAVNAARFGRTLGILTASAVPILDAMEAATQLVVPIPMKQALDQARRQVKEGQRIFQALKEARYFPPLFIHLVASGESSGQLDVLLTKAAGYLETDTEALMQNVLTLFEPCMILVMGGMVLFIVLAIMLPIFALDQMGGAM